MTWPQHLWISAALILAVHACTLCPPAAAAATEPESLAPALDGVSVSGQPLFAGPYVQGSCIPIEFLLQTGAVPVSGEIRAWAARSGSAPRIVGRRVTLPPFSQQRHMLYLEPPPMARGLTTALVLPDEREVGVQSFDCAVEPGSEILLIAAEETPRARIRALLGRNTAGRLEIRTLADLQALPDRAPGYSGFRSILLDHPDCSRLAPAQQAALMDWARLGGQLALSRPARDTMPADMRALIDAAFQGTDASDETTEAGPGAALGLGRLIMLPEQLLDGDVAPDLSAPIVDALLPRLHARPAPLPWPNTSRWASRLAGALPHFQLPTRKTILVATIAYAVAVGPALLLCLGRRHRLALHGWWVASLISLACALGVVAWNRHIRGRIAVAECITFARVIPASPPIALAETAIAILTPEAAQFDLSAVGSNWEFIPSWWTGGATSPGGRPLQEDPPRLHALQARAGQARLAYGRRLLHDLPAPRLASDAQGSPEWRIPEETLAGGTPERALLILPGEQRPLAPTPPDADGRDWVLRPAITSAAAPASQWDALRDQTALVLARDSPPAPGHALIAAWIADPAGPVRIEGTDGHVRSRTLWLIPVRID